MPNCLGIYVQDNLIKYAKVSKEHNNYKIEAYGVKFYEKDIEKTIEQIVQETFSYQVPISVNIDKEKYTYSDVFNLLRAQDLAKEINTEFEFFCSNNNKNKNTLEFRRLKARHLTDRDKVRVIYSYVDKANIVEKIQLFDNYKIHNIYPVATILQNLNKPVMQDNCALINIEQNTEMTTIVNGEVYCIDKIDIGMNNILKKISESENSISKAYEICKNSAVYTKTGQNLKVEGNEYIDEIIQVLFEIIEKIREKVLANGIEINNIYISGAGLVINNIDLLFQENFLDKKCEILVPYFIEKASLKINIKDYIEVNSAISLALQGLEPKEQETNFKGQKRNIWETLTTDVKQKSKLKVKKEKTKVSLKEIANSEPDFADKVLLRSAVAIILTIILYIAFSETLIKLMNIKNEEVNRVLQNSTNQIQTVNNYNSLVTSKTSEFEDRIKTIDEANSKISQDYLNKDAIPNLLNKIMYTVPEGVQIVLIKNTSDKSITIVAQAQEYDQLGYFKAVLDEEAILTNVTSSKATKKNNLISVTIKGELPY